MVCRVEGGGTDTTEGSRPAVARGRPNWWVILAVSLALMALLVATAGSTPHPHAARSGFRRVVLSGRPVNPPAPTTVVHARACRLCGNRRRRRVRRRPSPRRPAREDPGRRCCRRTHQAPLRTPRLPRLRASSRRRAHRLPRRRALRRPRRRRQLLGARGPDPDAGLSRTPRCMRPTATGSPERAPWRSPCCGPERPT